MRNNYITSAEHAILTYDQVGSVTLPSSRLSYCCLLYPWNRAQIAPSSHRFAIRWAFSRGCSQWHAWWDPRMTGCPMRSVATTWICAAGRPHPARRRTCTQGRPRLGQGRRLDAWTPSAPLRSGTPARCAAPLSPAALGSPPPDTAVARCTTSGGSAAHSRRPVQPDARLSRCSPSLTCFLRASKGKVKGKQQCTLKSSKDGLCVISLSVVFSFFSHTKCNTWTKAKAPGAANRLLILVCCNVLNTQKHPMHHDMQQSVFHITERFSHTQAGVHMTEVLKSHTHHWSVSCMQSPFNRARARTNCWLLWQTVWQTRWAKLVNLSHQEGRNQLTSSGVWPQFPFVWSSPVPFSLSLSADLWAVSHASAVTITDSRHAECALKIGSRRVDGAPQFSRDNKFLHTFSFFFPFR